MAEMIDKTSDVNKPSSYVFKVLSGSINGIEFSLGSHAYFMCVGDSTSADGQGNLGQNLEYAERTLYLPSTVPGHNFIVNLGEYVTEEEFVVNVNHPEHLETLSLAFNTICQVEGVYFALKREGEAWSQDVLKGVMPPLSRTDPTDVKEIATPVTKKSSGFGIKWVILTCLLLLLAVGGTAAWLNYSAAPAPESSTSVLQRLVGNNAGYSVQRGRDNTFYLFAQNTQQADWARQSVARSHPTESWKVMTPLEEELRLARVLERNNISFFTIRFNDLRAPTLVMSSTRNATDPAALEHVKNILLDTMPYAKKVTIELKADKDILRMAEEGLAALGFDYQMMQSDSGVTLSSYMSSGDSRMAEFNRFVSQFYRQWGRRYVHFSVELHDDNLKGKSFKYGQDGYVNMGKSHWLFDNQK